MCGFLETICPCLKSQQPEDDFDVIPEKGDYHGSRDFTGARCGFGIYRFENGDIYEGEWKKDRKHGFGEYRFKDGKILNGYFENDNFIGNPPPRSKSSITSNSAQPIQHDDIKSDCKPIKVKENKLGYSFAKTVCDIKQHVEKKKKKKKHHDEGDSSRTDVNERDRLIQPQRNEQTTYSAFQGQADPQITARIEEERLQKARERHEKHQARVDKIRKKYNIPGGGYVRT